MTNDPNRPKLQEPKPADTQEKVARPDDAETLRRRLAVMRAYLGIIG
jgi:hypothetical protein